MHRLFVIIILFFCIVAYGFTLNSRDSIALKPRLFGTITCNKVPLDGVRWEELPSVVSNKAFNFPITGRKLTLTPYKDGYYFLTPKISAFDTSPIVSRDIVAVKHALSDFQILEMTFDKTLLNKKDPDAVVVGKDAEFLYDFKKGNVLKLNKNATISYSPNNINWNNKSFSVSFWIKPYIHNKRHAVIAKGEEFSIRIDPEYVVFTVVDQKDYFCDIKIKDHVWTHLMFCVKESAALKVYLNGVLNKELKMGLLNPIEKELTIGNDIWEQRFIGEIDDIYMWNRVLSEEEVKHVFELKDAKSVATEFYLIGLVLLIGGIVFFLYRKKNFTKKSKPTQLAYVDSENKPLSICLFGPFQCIPQEGVDISFQFSPILKQLFVLLLIHKDGVSPKRIEELIWPDLLPENAKNTRNKAIRKLKETLEPAIKLNYEEGRWRMLLPSEIYVDYMSVLQLIKMKQPNEVQLQSLMTILKRGAFMSDVQSVWLDELKSNFENELLEMLLLHFHNAKQAQNNNLALQLVQTIRMYDAMDIEMVQTEIEILTLIGKKELARKTYDRYIDNYKKYYGTEIKETGRMKRP